MHCRNCPTFAAAAVTLLDRAAPPGYLADWAAHLARAESQAEADPAVAHNGVSSVVFRVETEWLALPTSVLQEVTELRAIHTLPHRRGGSVFGIINVRGELLICVSLAKLLGLEQAPPVQLGQLQGQSPREAQRLLLGRLGDQPGQLQVGGSRPFAAGASISMIRGAGKPAAMAISWATSDSRNSLSSDGFGARALSAANFAYDAMAASA